MNKFYIYFIIILGFTSCIALQKKDSSLSSCKKEAVKELKRWKKFIVPDAEGGIYTYLHKEVEVPESFETIFWERKIGRDFGVTVQVEDTTVMQYLQLALSLQKIIYSDCPELINKSELEEYFGKPTFITKSFLAHAKTSYHYSFNHPDGPSCYHGEYMGNVAYQECLTMIIEIDNKDQVVELNSSSFDLSSR